MKKFIPFKENDNQRGFELKDNGEVRLQFCEGASTHFKIEELRKVVAAADEKAI